MIVINDTNSVTIDDRTFDRPSWIPAKKFESGVKSHDCANPLSSLVSLELLPGYDVGSQAEYHARFFAPFGESRILCNSMKAPFARIDKYNAISVVTKSDGVEFGFDIARSNDSAFVMVNCRLNVGNHLGEGIHRTYSKDVLRELLDDYDACDAGWGSFISEEPIPGAGNDRCVIMLITDED